MFARHDVGSDGKTVARGDRGEGAHCFARTEGWRGGADNCEYERAVRLRPASVVRRSVMGVGWSESSSLLTQSSDPPAVMIFVYLRGEARSSLSGSGEVHVSLSTVRG